jgi:hypothetical protein
MLVLLLLVLLVQLVLLVRLELVQRELQGLQVHLEAQLVRMVQLDRLVLVVDRQDRQVLLVE